MNPIQEKTVSNAKSSVEATRRTLAELESFGWKPSATNQPIKDFDASLEMLETTGAAMRELKPANNKNHEKQLGEFISKESYLVESLDALARSAREALKVEQLAFFEARDELTRPMRDAAARADEDLQDAFTVFADRLQKKWKSFQNLHAVNLVLFRISHEHNANPRLGEPAMRLYAPFKGPVPTWYEFTRVHFARLTEVLSGGENWSPKDIAETAFRK